jgi:hypothetical protein
LDAAAQRGYCVRGDVLKLPQTTVFSHYGHKIKGGAIV